MNSKILRSIYAQDFSIELTLELAKLFDDNREVDLEMLEQLFQVLGGSIRKVEGELEAKERELDDTEVCWNCKEDIEDDLDKTESKLYDYHDQVAELKKNIAQLESEEFFKYADKKLRKQKEKTKEALTELSNCRKALEEKEEALEKQQVSSRAALIKRINEIKKIEEEHEEQMNVMAKVW